MTSTNYVPTVDEYLAAVSPATLYMETCFILVTDHGMEIASLTPGGDDMPVTQLYRHELPRDAIGDEMWERLTTGLRLRRWDHHNQKVVSA